MIWLAAYVVIGVVTMCYMKFSRGLDVFVSTVSGIFWPVTWIVLIADS